MTVEGTQQRVYGVLTSLHDCYIDLHRFAVVKDGTHFPTDVGAPVVYGDNTTYAKVKSCSHLYNGYFTIQFILVEQADQAEAVFEVHQCKTGLKYLFIETYGERITAGFSLSAWFNKGSRSSPDWVKLNDNFTTAWLEYKEYVASFKEYKFTSESYEMLCCKDCSNTCVCLSCNILSRIAFRTCNRLLDPLPTNPSAPGLSIGGTPVFRGYGITSNGDVTYLWEDGGGSTLDLYFEYKLNCNTIEIWAGDYYSHLYWDYTFYMDDDNVWHLLAYSGSGVIGPVYHGTFPFNYFNSCLNTTGSVCGNSLSMVGDIQTYHNKCSLVGKTVHITQISHPTVYPAYQFPFAYTATVQSVIDNIMRLTNLVGTTTQYDDYTKCSLTTTSINRSGVVAYTGRYDEYYSELIQISPGVVHENTRISFDYSMSCQCDGIEITNFVAMYIRVEYPDSKYTGAAGYRLDNGQTGSKSGSVNNLKLRPTYIFEWGDSTSLNVPLYIYLNIWISTNRVYHLYEFTFDITNIRLVDCDGADMGSSFKMIPTSGSGDGFTNKAIYSVSLLPQ